MVEVGTMRPTNLSICGLDPNDGCRYPRALLSINDNYPIGSTFDWYVNNVLMASTSNATWLYNPTEQCGSFIEFSVVVNTFCGASLPETAIVYFSCPDSYLSIYPNPAQNSINISINQATSNTKNKDNTLKTKPIRKIRISNKIGSVISENNYENETKNVTLDISTLKPDIYIIQVFDGIKWHSDKIIKN